MGTYEIEETSDRKSTNMNGKVLSFDLYVPKPVDYRVLVHIVGPWTNILVRICILNVIVSRKSTQAVSTQELLQTFML